MTDAEGAARPIVVGMTGATGAIYGVRLLEQLRELGVETHLVISRWAEATILDEPGGDTGWAALLKKEKGRWRVLLEGQDFTGAGRKYGVPKPLWKRWYLD